MRCLRFRLPSYDRPASLPSTTCISSCSFRHPEFVCFAPVLNVQSRRSAGPLIFSLSPFSPPSFLFFGCYFFLQQPFFTGGPGGFRWFSRFFRLQRLIDEIIHAIRHPFLVLQLRTACLGTHVQLSFPVDPGSQLFPHNILLPVR